MWSNLKNWLQTNRKNPIRRRQARFGSPASALIETLENRQLLTIVITPQFGPETVTWDQPGNPPGQSGNAVFATGNPILSTPLAAASSPYALKSPTVYLIFWGSDWVNSTTQALDPSVNQMISAAQTIVSPASGFLKGLTEFGSDGKATIGGAWYDTHPYSASGSDSGVELGKLLTNSDYVQSLNSLLGPASLPTSPGDPVQSPPVYIMVRSLNVQGGGNSYSKPGVGPAVNNISIDAGVGNLTNFGRLFSHELAERMADGYPRNVAVFASPTYFTYLTNPNFSPAAYYAKGGDQVADNEAEIFGSTYNFHLNGPKGPTVQAYYSLSRQSFIVNDADPTQDFVLTPHWQVNGPETWADAAHTSANVNTRFLGTYDLALNIASGDTLTIDAPLVGGNAGPVKITWNGHSETFDAGSLTNIQINCTGTGNHTIKVLHDFKGPTVQINLAGPGTATDVFQYQALFDFISVPLLGTQSFTVATVSNLEIFYSLSADHTLQQLANAGWTTIATNVKSFKVAPWAYGDEFEFYLTTDGQLYQSGNGVDFSLWQSGVVKFDVQNFSEPYPNTGTKNLLFVLDTNGNLTRTDGTDGTDGSSSPVEAVGVADFQIAHWAGTQTIFYLSTSHELYTSIWGLNFSFQGSGILSFGVAQMSGDGWLFALTASGVVQKSNGNGWQTVSTTGQQLQVARWAGRDHAFYLDNNGTLYSTFNASTWSNQGSGLTSFAIGSPEGLDTLFALSATGTLQRSIGNGWQTIATGVQSFQMADWATYKFVFYLDSSGTLFSSLDGIHWSNQGGPYQSFGVGKLEGTDFLFVLTGAGVLESSTGSGYQTVATGVQSFRIAPWTGLTTVFYLDSSAALQYSVDGSLWFNLGTSIQSFATGNLGGTDYVFGLTGDGVLEKSQALIFQTVATGVQSMQIARWAGKTYAFSLDNTNTLRTSPDGSSWTNQGGGIDSFDVIALHGVNTLLGLTTAGVLQRSVGNGWVPVATGVQKFQTSYWAGANYAYYLTFSGNLMSSVDGFTWLNQGSLIQDFDLGKLNGIGYLFGLTSSGGFQRSTGSGWTTLAAGVRSIQMGFWAGTNNIFYLDAVGELWTSSTGTAWNFQGGPNRSFAVGSLQGVHYLFALTDTAVLQKSTGSGWQTASIGVVSFQMARWAGNNYVAYNDSAHDLATSLDGTNWVTQDTGVQSFAITNLHGNNELFDLTNTGILKSSIGGGWNIVSYNVTSFQAAHWAGARYAFYLTSAGSLFTTLNGANWTNQGSNFLAFQVASMSGVDMLFALTSAGTLQRSTGSGWIVIVGGARSLQLGYWAGANHVFYQDGLLNLYSSVDGVNWATQGSNITSYAIINLNGVDFLFALTSDGTLMRSTGNGFINVAGNVRFFYLNNPFGVPQVFYITKTGQRFSTTDGYSWS
jgi:hypothetical protein